MKRTKKHVPARSIATLADDDLVQASGGCGGRRSFRRGGCYRVVVLASNTASAPTPYTSSVPTVASVAPSPRASILGGGTVSAPMPGIAVAAPVGALRLKLST